MAQLVGNASMPGTVFFTVQVPGRSPQSMSVGTYGSSNSWTSPSLLGGTTTQLPAGVTLADVQVRIGFTGSTGSAAALDVTLAGCS
ncbi:hypothetical protein XM48_02745 [Leucobacter sp. Ag1]|nr:hypothetical protein [Leucobacter sp. Ag1]KKI22205.1 hypothetical protein XM48_02745 [Leucobacter sp. Ag1]